MMGAFRPVQRLIRRRRDPLPFDHNQALVMIDQLIDAYSSPHRQQRVGEVLNGWNARYGARGVYMAMGALVIAGMPANPEGMRVTAFVAYRSDNGSPVVAQELATFVSLIVTNDVANSYRLFRRVMASDLGDEFLSALVMAGCEAVKARRRAGA